MVRYAGIISQGRHPKLIDEDTFETVQGLLTSKRTSGERCWIHYSYLRGSVFCGARGSRLIYTRATGRNGSTYEYFVCHGKSKRLCNQPHHRVEAVEQAIEREYTKVQLTPAVRDGIRADVRAYAAQLDGRVGPERGEIQSRLKQLAVQERKLLEAHYQDQISPELFAEEQRRIRQERVAVERRQQELDVDHGRTLEQLEAALAMTGQLQTAYLLAEPNTRRLLNQAIFRGFWIDREEIARAELASPFMELVERVHETPGQVHQKTEPNVIEPELEAWTLEPDPEALARNQRTRNQVALVTGSNVEKMMVLVRQLSNPACQQTLQRAAEIARQRASVGPVRLPIRPKPRVPVSDAITSVLSTSSEPSMRMVEIHAAVRRLLQADISRSAVKAALLTDRFVRVSRGRYRLRPV